MERDPVNKAISIILGHLNKEPGGMNDQVREQISRAAQLLSDMQGKIFRYKVAVYALTAINIGLVTGLVWLMFRGG